MIEKFKEGHGIALGFKISGEMTAGDIEYLSEQLDSTIALQKKPLGLLLDISSMYGTR